MSKKLISLISLFIICISLTGCMDVIDITDTERVLIAEYAADLLLKYDINHDDRLDEGEKIEQEMIEEAEEDELNGITPVTTEAYTDPSITEESTDAATDNNGHNLNSNIDDIDGETVEGDDNGTAASDAAAVSSGNDIARVVGLDGVSITYKDYLITDHYPATDEDGEFLYLEATEGYQLLVLRFNVTDTVEDSVSFSMLDKNVDYKLVCNNKNAANPMLTILMNDLGTMEAVLSPGEATEGVLVFQISDDMQAKLNSMELNVQYNGSENIINIL